MESIVRNVRDIDTMGRQALERLLGRQLQDDHQVIVQVVTTGNPATDQHMVKDGPTLNQLPEWCNVYAGLDDCQITEIEKVFGRRADLSRGTEQLRYARQFA